VEWAEQLRQAVGQEGKSGAQILKKSNLGLADFGD
jgi:hypothetical protein